MVERFREAANACLPCFPRAAPEPIRCGPLDALEDAALACLVERYRQCGFAVAELCGDPEPRGAVTTLSAQLGLGEPFVPALYRRGDYKSAPLTRISVEGDGGGRHPYFDESKALPMHCDGTLQPLGMVKTSLLYCVSPAASGGETLLFNAAAAFAELLAADAEAALALTAPGVLTRKANVNESNESISGPAFAIHKGALVCGYSVAATDSWSQQAPGDAEALRRALTHFSRASKPGSPHVLALRLDAAQVLLMDNGRISHGRNVYHDTAERRRVFYRGLFLRHPKLTPDPARTGERRSPGPPPPFDPELREALPAVLSTVDSPLTPQKIMGCRQRSVAAQLGDAEIEREGSFALERVELPASGCSGDRIELLLCRPNTAPGPHGLLFHVHGGGMVAGSPRSLELAFDLNRAHALRLAVASIDYRLAPEHPDPAPVEDCNAALRWIAANAGSLGFDPDRIVLSGNSAGGSLAMGVALLCRDRGGPAIRGAMLQCPMLDDRCDTVSARQMEAVGVWDTRSNRTGWDALLGSRRGRADVSAYAAPARAEDLAKLPPVFIDAGSAESLRDEAVTFASRIWAAGGEAELHIWAGAFHSFDQWAPGAVVSAAAEAARMSWLRRILR